MKFHFDILDFCLAVFLFVILASGGLSISDTYTAPNTQVALVSGSLAQADYYQSYSEGNHGATQTRTYGAYGNTGSPTGNTGSPADNTGSPPNGGTSDIPKSSVETPSAESPVVDKTGETEEEKTVGTAMIARPNYKKTEKWVYICKRGYETCNEVQGKRIEEKFKRNLTFLFMSVMIPEIKLPTIERMSKKETTQYQPFYTKTYGIKTRQKEDTYQNFINPLSVLLHPTKVGKAETKTHEFSTGPKGVDQGVKSTESVPDITPTYNVGKFSVTIPSERMVTEYSVDEESPSILLYVPPIKEKNAAVKFAEDYIKGTIEGIPLIGSAIENKLLEKKYLVLLKVEITQLLPVVDATGNFSLEEKPIPCKEVKVAGKPLDVECRVTFTMTQRKGKLDVTPHPNANIKYYRYDIGIDGPVKQAATSKSATHFTLSELLGIKHAYAEEGMYIDEDGYLVTPGWDDEDLPIVSQTAPYQDPADLSSQARKEAIPTETPTPTPVPASTTPPPSLWQKIVNFFTWGEAKPPVTAAKTPVRKSVAPTTATTTTATTTTMVATTTATTNRSTTRFATSTQNATSTSSQFFSTTTAVATTTTITFANSFFVKSQAVAVGTTTVIGGFAAYVAGEPVSVKNFRFRAVIGGGPALLKDILSIKLYGPNGEIVSEGVIQPDETILFTRTFTILTAQNTYLIKAVLGSRFKTGQTIQLYANFYKDDAIFTGTKSGKNVSVSKNTLNLSRMSIR